MDPSKFKDDIISQDRQADHQPTARPFEFKAGQSKTFLNDDFFPKWTEYHFHFISFFYSE